MLSLIWGNLKQLKQMDRYVSKEKQIQDIQNKLVVTLWEREPVCKVGV